MLGYRLPGLSHHQQGSYRGIKHKMVAVDDLDQEKLIRAWIALQEAEEESAFYERNLWAGEKLWEFSQDNPELCWKIILEILDRNLSDKIMGNLAAGPLEDLLAAHGPKFIERIERQASQDKHFRILLGGVWQNEMSNDVWKRVQIAAERN